MEPTPHPLTLTVEQAAKVLGIGRSTAYELVHTGAIPSLRLGRRIVVPTARLCEQLGASHDEFRMRSAQSDDRSEARQESPGAEASERQSTLF